LHIKTSDSIATQVEIIATQIHSLLCTILSKQDTATIALSGGKSPIPLLTKLSTLDLEWDRITVTLVDERVVPTNHDDSNENLIRKHLLKNKASNASFIGLICLNDSNIINEKVYHLNNIDIAVLGMGTDGHTASIFPDCSEFTQAIDMNNNDAYILTNPISANYQRISLTLKALSNIKNLILSINGNEKLNILNEAAKIENKNYPISYLLKQRPDINIYWHE
jgi:6-phosphogluconolactonase